MSDLRLKPNQLATKLAFKRNAQRGMTFLLVEGPTDQKFWRGFVSDSHCELVVADGRSNVLSIIEKLTGGTGNANHIPGVLAIIDDDHDSVLNRREPHPHIVRTDGTDLEAMLAWGQPLSRLLDSYADFERLAARRAVGEMEVRDGLFALAAWWGKLRALARLRNLSLNFAKELSISRFLDEQSLSLDTLGLLNQASALGLAENADSLQAELRAFDRYSLVFLAQGHDLLKILSIGLKRVWGNNNKGEVGENQLAITLFSSTYPQFVSTTNTYADIQLWESQNSPYLVLKVKTQPELDTTLA